MTKYRYLGKSPPVITVDVERYDYLLEHTDLTRDERALVLQELWNLVVALVDFGYRVEPLEDIWGQDGEMPEIPTLSANNPLSLEHQQLFEKFIGSAQSGDANKPEGVDG